jgi:hypothetical protein
MRYMLRLVPKVVLALISVVGLAPTAVAKPLPDDGQIITLATAQVAGVTITPAPAYILYAAGPCATPVAHKRDPGEAAG